VAWSPRGEVSLRQIILSPFASAKKWTRCTSTFTCTSRQAVKRLSFGHGGRLTRPFTLITLFRTSFEGEINCSVPKEERLENWNKRGNDTARQSPSANGVPVGL
jgi:hypothetical protein